MTLKIISQSFTINTNMVEPALEALKKEYPEVIQILDYNEPTSNLQLMLFTLGYHVRINYNNSTIFTFSILPAGSKIENEDPIKTITTLSTYMTEDSYITVNINGEERTFKNTSTITVPSVEYEIKPEIVKLTDTEEIKPQIISKSTRKRNKRIFANTTDEEFREI